MTEFLGDSIPGPGVGDLGLPVFGPANDKWSLKTGEILLSPAGVTLSKHVGDDPFLA